MGRIKIKPREIDASLVEVGDEISAEYQKDNGITMTLKGIVGKRVDMGRSRHLMTAEGATIVSWDPKNPRAVKCILYSREEPENAGIFDLEEYLTGSEDAIMQAVRERAN